MKHTPDASFSKKSTGWGMHVLFTVLIFILVSLACTVPDLTDLNIGPAKATVTPLQLETLAQATLTAAAPVGGSKGGTPVPQAQAPAATVNPAVRFAPALVEVEPLPGSEISPSTAPVFYFNQAMDRGSVEGAFTTQPDLGGRFEWINDAAVRFVPGKTLGAGAAIRLTIGSGAKATNGITMAEPVQVNYQTSGPLLLTQRLPAPDAVDINPSSAVVVAFNRPVVPLGADPQGLPAAFSLDPPAVGRGEWLNTSTYIFYPQPALMGGAQYTVHLNSSLTSVDGGALDSSSSLEWAFSTSLPVLLSVQPGTEQPVPLDSAFTLVFNQPMDSASVEGNFSLLGPAGAVTGTFSWNSTSTEMTFQPNELLQREAEYTLALFGTASSLGGAAIGQDFAASLVTVPQFAITQTRPAAGETLNAFSGYGSVTLTFSSPVAVGQDFDSLITLDPPVVGQSVSRDFNGYQMYVSGYFLPSTSYTLEVSPALADRWGAKLDAPYSITFSSQPAEPSLVVPVLQAGANSLFVPQREASLPVRTTNIERLSLSRGRLSLSDFIGAEQDWQGLQNWESKVQASWPVLLYPTADVSEENNIPLAPNGEGVDPGLYFLKIDSQPALAGQLYSRPVLLVVSPVQLVFKVSARQAFVWAVRVPENAPVPDAEIIFYDNTATAVSSCTTDAQGTCQAALPERSDPYSLLYAVLGQPGDRVFSLAASSWQNGVAAWEFGLPYENKGTLPEVYFYTDRPIYRPGQTVNFRAIVLEQDNARYSKTAMSQVTAEIASPYDEVTGQSQMLAEIRLALDPYGSASGVYMLPDDARPGTYTLRLREGESQGINFEVAEYRKPEIDLQVSYEQPDALVGNDLQAQVTAKYFFGAPASNLPLRWSLFRSRGMPDITGGFQTGKLDTSWLEPWGIGSAAGIYVMEGQAQTGPDGAATIHISGQELRDRLDSAAGDLNDIVLEVTMEDESGLPVSARGTMRLHPSPFYIGVRPEQWTVQAAQEITYSVRTVDWQGNPAADKLLTAHFVKVKWVQQEVTDPQAPPDYHPEYTEVGSTDFRTSPEGEARLAFIPAEPGTFMLEISGGDTNGDNGGVLTQVLTWVGGTGATEWPNLPNQRILLRSSGGSSAGGSSADKPFQPGETARVFIPNPFEGGALALVTIERGKVMRSQVVEIHDASYNLELPLIVEDAPNVFVSVTLLGQTNNRPDFRVGYLELHVDPQALVLNVEVETSPQQPQPGADVTVNIRVKDADGKPVQGEFSLALIDKAVLALADPNSPPIVQAFYGRQPLGVQSSFSLAEYSGRFLYLPPGRGGGGGDGAQASAPVRTNFADTAYWNGTVITDVTGTAQLRLTLPDNLTTWRADVRGLAADMRMGQATADLTASKPLLIRPVTPRFAVPGDHLAMAAVVHNNTQNALEASVRLEGSGFSLDDPNQAVQRIEIPGGERRQVTWWGTVQDVTALDLTFSAESTTAGAAALQDAARPERSPLPVLPYTAAQTFATTGLLDKAGEKLELVSLPRSFTPLGGELRVELSPSLSAAVMEGLEALEVYPRDFTEPVLSRLLPNLATYQALKELNLENAALPGATPLRSSLEGVMTDSVDRLVRLQNEDGGWGWAAGYASDPYISSYALFGLSRAAQSGVFVDPQVVQRGRDYLSAVLVAPDKAEAWQVDRLAFQYFALQQAGMPDLNVTALYDYRDKLSPWGKAFLAMVLETQSPGDPRARTLLSDLEASATRSATGASWQDPNPAWHNWSTTNFTTAVAAYAIARVNPASPLLVDAARYIVLNRQSDGGWYSSYETAWSLMALVEVVRGTGDLQASYSYSATLNGSPLADGKVENPSQAVNPVTSTVPLSALYPDSPNALTIQRGDGNGRLYYRAHLQVNRSAEDAPATQRGLSITRQYYRSGQDCRQDPCLPVDSVDLGDPQPILVRLTLTVPEDMHYVVVEDTFPAGTEALNPRLKTSQQNIVPAGEPSQSDKPVDSQLPYNPENPFEQGWGWWLFKDPQVYDDHIRWVVDALPAGTYELTYRLTPFLAGEFRVIPAHAWSYYFPEVEGTSQGGVLIIQ